MSVRDHPPIKLAGLALLAIIALTLTLVYLQFKGDLSPKTQLTLVSGRAGLVMDPGSKVTYNGVEIGRVATVSSTESNGESAARITMNVNPRFLAAIPANVDADIKATTIFGNKYVSLTTPKNPTRARISSADIIK